MQNENDEAKDYLCSQFCVPESHIELLKEFCPRVDSNWVKEKSRRTPKLDQFRKKSCNPIACTRKFDAKFTNSAEPR
jgi:hypothetical protein